MSRPMSGIRNGALPLAPIPESSPVNFQQPLPSTIPSASTSPSEMMTTYNNQFIGGMPVSFWQTPDNAVAAFSTQLGRYPKRQLPRPLPAPIIRSNMNHDVQKKAQSLVKQFPELARRITPINEWYHLYKYFDAYELWIEGAAFCFFVIHRIGMINEQLIIEQRDMIEDFAKEWVASHGDLIINSPPTRDLITLFDDADRGNLIDMREDEKMYLMDRLDHHRHLLVGRVAESRRRAVAQPVPPIVEPAPPAMMGPYPGIMFTPPSQGFPQGPLMIDPQRTPILSPAQGVSPSHQTYNQFVESQRNLASRFNPVVPPSNLRNESNHRPVETRPRGWSNDTARNGRGGRANGWYNYNGNPNMNGRRWVSVTTPRGSPPRQSSSSEPIYVLTSQQSSPQDQRVTSSQRIVSDPINSRDPYPQISQRALSDSPAGPGIFNAESATASPVVRKASSTDGNIVSNYPSKNKVNSQCFQTARSENSTPRATLINDARVLEAMEKQDGQGFLTSPEHPPRPYTGASPYNDPHRNIELQTATIGNGGQTHTYHYAGPPRRLSRAEQGTRTVYVGGVPYELFRNHTLKKLLSECGDLDNISYLYDSGHAFAAFIEESSVPRAVQRFDGYQLGPNRLTVNLPRNRMRGDSFSSQRSFTSTRTTNMAPRDIDQRSRRPSFGDGYNHHVRSFSRNSVDAPHHFRNFSRYSTDAPVSPSRIEGKLMSSVSEVIQHSAALNRIGSQMPLERIENHFSRNSQTNIPNYDCRNSSEPFSQLGQYNRKENSPMKSDRPPMTPSRKCSFSSQTGGSGSRHVGGKNKRSRVSRQNSSTSARPTPTATPTKSRSESILSLPIQGGKSAADSKEVHEEKSTSTATEETDVPAKADGDTNEQEKVVAEKPKSKRRAAKKKNTFKSESENAMASDNSNNASFATESSSDTLEAISPVGTESSMGFMTSKSTSTSFSTLPSRKPSVVSSISTPPMSEIPEEKDSISMKTVFPKYPEINEKSTTPKPSQLSSKTPEVEVKPRSASGKSHSKKESVVSTTSTTSSSLRKADAKSQSKSDVQPQTPEAKINIDDQKEFPALGPAKSPVAAIADGKRPPAPSTQKPPVIGTLSERVISGSTKNQVKPAVPLVAVPRSYMPRPQPVLRDPKTGAGVKELTNDGGKDDIGSKTWPFVKKVKAK